MGVIDYSTLLTVFHLLGVAFGVGGAFASDFIFFSSVKDEKVSRTEMRFLHLGSAMVWIGLGILVISGGLIFLTDVSHYLDSSKFLAKMTIVGIILINGIFFHALHLPRLRRHVGTHFPSSDEFTRKFPLLLGSGAVSAVSWLSALFLGAAHKAPFSYFEIMGFYAVILVVAIGVALSFKNALLKKRQ